MKASRLTLLAFGISVAAMSAGAAPAGKELLVTSEPFEPSYKAGDKFKHPREVIAPRFLWPFEMRRGAISGEVVVLVELDGKGRAKRLATLYSTHPLFTRSAIQALRAAQWDSTVKDWFYYKVVFDIEKEEPNQAPEPTPTAGTSAAEQPCASCRRGSSLTLGETSACNEVSRHRDRSPFG